MVHDEDDEFLPQLDEYDSTDQFEDAMADLIGQLDSDDPEYVADKMSGVVIPSPPLVLTDVPPQPSPETLPDPSNLRPVDVRRVDQSDVTTISEEPVVQAPLIDFRHQFEQLETVSKEVLEGTRADRQEVQDVITLMLNEINKSIQANGQPARMYLDNITKALEVKSNINMTAVKVLEARAKLLAATRAGTIINNMNNNANNNLVGLDQELDGILARSRGEEDEF